VLLFFRVFMFILCRVNLYQQYVYSNI